MLHIYKAYIMYSAGSSVQSVKKALRHPSRKKDRKLFFDKSNRINRTERKNVLNSDSIKLSDTQKQQIKNKLTKQRKIEKTKKILLFMISIIITIFLFKILLIPFKQIL